MVSENQRRATIFNDFSVTSLFPTDAHGPFSDEAMVRRYTNLASVWLPPGWVWLDERWDVEREADPTDTAGWQYVGEVDV